MNPWIAADLARFRHEEAERRHRATTFAAEARRPSASRWLGHLLIRAGRRLGGDAGIASSPPPNVGTLGACVDGPGLPAARQLPLRLHAH